MKKKWLNLAKADLEMRGYKSDWLWCSVYGQSQSICYIHKGRNHYLATVSTCTGTLLIEILKRKEILNHFDINIE